MADEYALREEGCDRCGMDNVEVTVFHNRSPRPYEKDQYDEDGNTHVCAYCYETNLSRVSDPNTGRISELAIQLTHALHVLERRIKSGR